MVVVVLPLDAKAAGSRGDQVEVDRRGERAGMAEHHVGRTGSAAAVAVVRGADEQVADAVTIDVARRGYRPPGTIAVALAPDLEAAAAAGDGVEVDRCCEAGAGAEHDIG